jgi:hypothetical protein
MIATKTQKPAFAQDARFGLPRPKTAGPEGQPPFKSSSEVLRLLWRVLKCDSTSPLNPFLTS